MKDKCHQTNSHHQRDVFATREVGVLSAKPQMTLATEPRFTFIFAHPRPLLFLLFIIYRDTLLNGNPKIIQKQSQTLFSFSASLICGGFLGVDLWRQAHEEKRDQKGSNLRPSKLKVIARSHEPPPLLLAKTKSQYCVVLTQKLFIHRLFELEAPFCRRMFCRQTNRS